MCGKSIRRRYAGAVYDYQARRNLRRNFMRPAIQRSCRIVSRASWPRKRSTVIFNASTNPVGALTQLHHGAATRFAPTNALFEDLIAEGETVARALGIELHGDPRQMVQKGANAPGQHRASMLQDVLAKRQTEVDFMNGAIAQWGDKVGVPTPLNKALWGLIKGLEHSWKDPD